MVSFPVYAVISRIYKKKYQTPYVQICATLLYTISSVVHLFIFLFALIGSSLNLVDIDGLFLEMS